MDFKGFGVSWGTPGNLLGSPGETEHQTVIKGINWASAGHQGTYGPPKNTKKKQKCITVIKNKPRDPEGPQGGVPEIPWGSRGSPRVPGDPEGPRGYREPRESPRVPEGPGDPEAVENTFAGPGQKKRSFLGNS